MGEFLCEIETDEVERQTYLDWIFNVDLVEHADLKGGCFQVSVDIVKADTAKK